MTNNQFFHTVSIYQKKKTNLAIILGNFISISMGYFNKSMLVYSINLGGPLDIVHILILILIFSNVGNHQQRN